MSCCEVTVLDFQYAHISVFICVIENPFSCNAYWFSLSMSYTGKILYFA